MVYKCSICGYEYDEEKEGKPFSELTECPICKYGIRPGEAAAKNQNGQICHARCVEEERYGAQFTNGHRYR